jgi:2-succinyl-5-enolpyruvyl-6-hydroxy-3-cyclohexene-1-carboxylate synthase
VLLENGGGGIFDFLPVAGARMARAPELGGAPAPAAGAEAGRAQDTQDIYTRHVATPTGLDFATAAELYGVSHERVVDVFELRAALERSLNAAHGSSIIEVRGERVANVELHRRIWEAVSRSLSPPGGGAAPPA